MIDSTERLLAYRDRDFEYDLNVRLRAESYTTSGNDDFGLRRTQANAPCRRAIHRARAIRRHRMKARIPAPHEWGAYMLPEQSGAGCQQAHHRILHDIRGSVRLVYNTTTGAITQRLDYDEFGVVTANTAPFAQPFGYAGGEYDHLTGLTRFGARDYDPTLGRWTAPDPIGFAGGDSNLYSYVGGDPVNKLDVSGLCPAAAAGAIPVAPLAATAAGLYCLMNPACLEALGELGAAGVRGVRSGISSAGGVLDDMFSFSNSISDDDAEATEGAGDPTEDEPEDCIARYVDCNQRYAQGEGSYGMSTCGDCMRFCEGQGYWPIRLANGQRCL